MRLHNRAAFGFLLPYLLIFATFWIWPIVDSFLISFQNTRVIPWVFSTANWVRIVNDPAYLNALKNTLLLLLIQVPLMTAMATLLAVLLNSTLIKGRAFVRFAFFAPVVVGEVAYSAVFRLMFNPDFGIVNKTAAILGLPAVRWFDNPTAAMTIIIVAVTWRWAGYNAVIILAGLQGISEDVYEAATLDRVTPTRQFFFITLPLLRPVLLFCIVLSVIGTMTLFTEPYLITNHGGPGGGTETLGVFLNREAFVSTNFGFASAVAYTMAALAIMISILNLWAGRERVR